MTVIKSLLPEGLTALWSRLSPPVPEAIAGRVRWEQLSSILRLTPVMMTINIVNALLVCLAGFNSHRRNVLIVWTAAVACYGLLGLRGWVASRRRKSGKNTVSARGARRIALQAGVLGALWGVLPVFALDDAGTYMNMLIVGLMAGMIGTGSFALLTLPMAALAYTTPLVAGSLFVLLTSGEPILLALAGLLIFCYLVVGLSCLSHAKVFVERWWPAKSWSARSRWSACCSATSRRAPTTGCGKSTPPGP
ncbi:hypothetical protein BH10PSE3_BH10PSE3_15880 [soil metagenome]